VKRLVICGSSTRAAAESAARAGFAVTAIDGFADLDQHPAVRALSASRDFAVAPTASAMSRATQGVDCDAVVYLSPFENHTRAVTMLGSGRALWGNTVETLRSVRNPFLLARLAQRHGFAFPRVWNASNASNDPNDPNDSNDSNDSNGSWLVKPFRSGGGNRIHKWQGGRVPQSSYLQERIEGTPGSLVFVAAAGECVPLGFSRQLVGDSAFGASGFRYCGNILASVDDSQFANGHALFDAAVRLAGLVTAEFNLVGLNGIDFMARDGVPVLLEVNPRWSSSVEVAERAFQVRVFQAHADACDAGRLSPFDLTTVIQRTAAFGKAIVYAREDGFVADSSTWLSDPDVRDVPRSGQRFRAGQPVCSVFAAAPDSSSCYRALVGCAERIYRDIEHGARARRVTVAG